MHARFHGGAQLNPCLLALALHQPGDVDVVELQAELFQDLLGVALGDGEHQGAVGMEETVFRDYECRWSSCGLDRREPPPIQ